MATEASWVALYASPSYGRVERRLRLRGRITEKSKGKKIVIPLDKQNYKFKTMYYNENLL